MALALTGTLALLSGCGGGGGPMNVVPPGGGGGTTAEFLALLPAGQQGATYVGTAVCIGCHETGKNGAPVVDIAAFKATKHNSLGVGCEQCHGPGSKHQAGPSTETILTMPLLSRAAVCAQCHGPMANEFKNSPHSQVIAHAVEAGTTCLRCHSSSFRTDMIEMPLAAGRTADQIDAAILAMSADEVKEHVETTTESASCVACHNPMKTTDNLMWKAGKQAQLRHPEGKYDTSDMAQGAAVKNYTVLNQACATCHNGRGIDGRDAALTSGTARPNTHGSPQYQMLMGLGGSELPDAPATRNTAHANAPGQCAHCHMPDSHHTMTVSFDTSCAPCHSAGDAAARYAIRGVIEANLVALKTRLGNWAKAKFGDADLWEYTTNIPAGKTAPPQSQIPIEVKRARHNYYLVTFDGSFGVHNSTYTRYLLNMANLNLTNLGVAKPAPVNMTPAQLDAFAKSERARAKSNVE